MTTKRAWHGTAKQKAALRKAQLASAAKRKARGAIEINQAKYPRGDTKPTPPPQKRFTASGTPVRKGAAAPVKKTPRVTPPQPPKAKRNRRTKAQAAQDQQKILDHVRKAQTGTLVRQESWMSSSDINKLVESGQLEREVRREWDKSTGYQANMFGGAAVMQRRRAYLKVVQKASAGKKVQK